jgi:hypothetical protein
MHFTEFRTLKRLSKYVHPHLFGGAISEINFTRVIGMFPEEISCFDVFCAFGTGCMTIFFKG